MPTRRSRTGDGAGRPAPSTLPFPTQVEKAREDALRLLATRERSAAEIRARLRRRGYGPEAIIAVLDRLQETGLQSDERFSERYAADAGARGLASRRIRTELRTKGIDEELAVTAALEGAPEDGARARAWAQKRAARMAGMPPEVRFRRLAGALARRGYDAETCREVARDLSRWDPDEDPPSG